jgi:glutamine synthetase
MQGSSLTPEQVLEEVRQSPNAKVKVAVTDVDGVLRGKYVHRDKFLSAVGSGFGFCSVIFGWDCHDACYDNSSYTGWHTGYPDAQAQLDLNSFRRVPWDNDVPFFLADFVDNEGKALAQCPRQLLKQVLARAEKKGYAAQFGVEYEWFNFRETPQSLADKKFANLQTLTPGMFGYSVLRASANQPYVNALFDELGAFGVPLEGLHTETGPGVFEGAILHCDPLEAADRGVLFKTAVKEIALRHNVTASFMAKWSADLPGCGGHVHQSLCNRDGVNLFYDARDPHRMSKTFKHYVAGQIHCLPQVLPMFAPNVNSYKRLVEGAWAPTRVTWGYDNRTTALRVIPGSARSTRLETRVGGADNNAYLTIAASLAAGMYGVEHELELPMDAVEGSAYAQKDALPLPTNLFDAAEKMLRSEVAVALFGKPFVDHYAHSRLWEWKQFQKAITGWELERYFEII